MMESVNRLYSIYDTAAKRYGPIFEAVNDEVAARNYAGVLKTQIPEHYHSEYKLMFLGTIDFVSGEIQQLAKPEEVFITVSKKTESMTSKALKMHAEKHGMNLESQVTEDGSLLIHKVVK